MRPIGPMIGLALAGLLCAAPALAQQRRNVYPDEGVGTRDALVRVRELSEAGNMPEALRVLQKTLEAEGDQLVVSTWDKDVFVPIRAYIHTLVLASPDLLTRYRSEQDAQARQMLAQGRLPELEQTRMLTTPGYEAVLRLAQREFEAARFESARLMLQQLEKHPDRAKGSKPAADAARIAGLVGAQLARADVLDWARRWASEAGLAEQDVIPSVPAPPPDAVRTAVSPLDPQRLPELSSVPHSPLQSVVVDQEHADMDKEGEAPAIPQYQLRYARTPWIIPTVQGDVVYINDGKRITAWDSATLGQIWQVTPSRSTAAQQRPGLDDIYSPYTQPGALMKEDLASVTVLGGVAVATTGSPDNGRRLGDPRVHAIDAATGRVLWSVDVTFLSPKLNGAVVRGPAVIDADTVVLTLRKRGEMRQATTVYEAGIDLYTGGLKWLRLVGTALTQSFTRAGGRAEGSVVSEGIVYRGDEMGVVCAYEAASGRPVWVRLGPTVPGLELMQFRPTEAIPPQDMAVPVVAGDSLLYVEQPRGRVVRASRADGRVLASRDGGALDNPRYLVQAGEYLGAVNDTRVSFIKIAELEEAAPQRTNPPAKGGIVGRVTSAGDQVLVPVEGGVVLINPAAPTQERRVDIAYSGNTVVAGVGKTHLLTVDMARVHTYLEWAEAQTLLDARVAARPKDPQPLLTYIELASRTGRSELVPALADKALALLDADASSTASLQGRERLFALLIEVARNSRYAWTTKIVANIPGVAQPVKDIALLDQIMQRLGSTAESPADQVAMLLEKGWLREKQNDGAGAIEAYQQVLTDTGLGAVEVDLASRLGADMNAGAPTTARGEASERLIALVRRVGPGPYAAFDEEAERALAQVDETKPEKIAGVARSYPVARIAPEAWNRASAAYARAGGVAEARLAAGAGLRAAELGASIGREGQLDMLGTLAGSLMSLSTGATDAEPVYRLMRRLARDHPGLAIAWEGSKAPPSEAASRLRARIAARSGLPIIGSHASHDVQVLDGWEPLEPLSRGATGASADSIAMVNEAQHHVALWAVAAEDGRLHPLWTRPYQMRPIVIRIMPDAALFFWPTASGGSVESIVSLDGQSEWRTRDFAALFGELPEFHGPDRLPTPLDGPVHADDLMVTADGATLVLVQRRGRAGAFDLTDGRVLWSAVLELNRAAYDAEQSGDYVVIGGMGVAGRGGPEKAGPGVIALDKRTGKVKSRLDQAVLGDHSRWLRAAGKDMLVATAQGLVRFDPSSGKVLWSMQGTPGQGSLAGWVVGDGLYVLDGDVNLWWVSLKDGTHAPTPLDSRGRIIFPVSAVVMGNTLAISSTMGMVVYNDKGELVGADGLDGMGSIQSPVATQTMFVAVENNQHEDTLDQGIVSRIFFFDHPSGKLLNTERVRLYENPHTTAVIDGKILLTEGPVTLVLDAAPDGARAKASPAK